MLIWGIGYGDECGACRLDVTTRARVNLPGMGAVMTETGVYVLDLRKFLER